ncbi:hypothetical protein [Bradyrhizobium sp.]|uniref:hypothetical protein n=1 Tax=Bradyrhizobium sp. TaxID=376 RepID=UPI002BC2CC67|nr:hypothetical protein [Bradyrhizobium sp.]HWX59977.1 hypothetical protein [Bradyrhizobium sp.]
MIVLRKSVLLVCATAGFAALLPARASAEWWSRAPADFEECADNAEKLPAKEARTDALAECNAKFAGRRKVSGGYTYYDFMQDRTFDIAGPNPTAEEQKYIDEQYALFLEKQRRKNIAAAFAAQQQQQQQEQEQEQEQIQQASLNSDAERIPLPQNRPTKAQMAAALTAACQVKYHDKNLQCPYSLFDGTRLSEGLSRLTKWLNMTSNRPNEGKGPSVR